MSGLRLVIDNADFSANKVGVISSPINDYFTRANITDPAKRNAVKVFYNSGVSGGWLGKLSGIGFGEAIDTAFTNMISSGNIGGVWNNPTSFHMHVYNRHAMVGGVAGDLGWNFGNYPSALSVLLSTSGLGFTGNIGGDPQGPGCNFNSATGLFSSKLSGTTFTAYKDGASVTTSTVGAPVLGAGIGFLPPMQTYPAGRELLMGAWGQSNWTNMDETNLYNAFQTLKTSLGL